MNHAFRLLSGLGGVLMLLGAAGPVSAQAMQEYEYRPGRIYEVRAGLGITTQIELGNNEKVLDYSTGFSSGWELDRRENVFYLKPNNVDVDTNMLVRTDKREYIFELKVVATDWTALEQAKRAGVQYKITFEYPADPAFDEAVSEAVGQGRSSGLEPGRIYNFEYSYASRSESPWLIPVTVYDDGRFTYIEMPDLSRFPTGNFPAIFGREKRRGDDFVVNATVEKNMIVIHGTYPFLVIRHGENAVGLRRNAQQ
jgi:type IV secretion system protein VirB9